MNRQQALQPCPDSQHSPFQQTRAEDEEEEEEEEVEGECAVQSNRPEKYPKNAADVVKVQFAVNTSTNVDTLFKVLWLLLPNVWCQKKTLDEYCFSQLPGMINDLPGITSFLHLIRICSDIGIYNDCLLNRHASQDGELKLQLYEQYFPDNSSIEYAGYIFCSINFPMYPDRYSIGGDKMNDCQKKVDFPKCDKVVELDAPFLQSAIAKKEAADVKSISCKMNYKHWKCIKEQFESCSKDTGPMFEYYIARLGDDCLIHHLEPNPVILTVQCVGGGEAGDGDNGNTGTGPGNGGAGDGGGGKRNGGAGAQYREGLDFIPFILGLMSVYKI